MNANLISEMNLIQIKFTVGCVFFFSKCGQLMHLNKLIC